MASMFRSFFFLGLLGIAIWLLYAVFFPATLLWESVGVACISLAIIGLTVWQTIALLERARTRSKVEAYQTPGPKGFTATQFGKLRKWHLGVLVSALLVVLAFVGLRSTLIGNAEIAARTMQSARVSCTNFIDREFNSRRYTEKAKTLDSWVKMNKVVVEIGWKDSASASSYTTRLCVYDPMTRYLDSPGAFGRFRWEK
ncbi:hypothetical protein [Shimia marina]|uniref:Uncharacterized protein n=1 Tax=Shimia marina TaxID=321267 RepID=A0A0N7LS60_9RHOB|nr:hypothetical protein [Shimia marina]CUH52716.1 hypothetical protein SHM7688_02163 [Shimia marina]SFE82769.1 hypothetical protein SAMN04488037_1292 [Shimia marina]